MTARWTLGLGLLVAVSGGAPGCISKTSTKKKPFTCERFEQRTHQCKKQLLAVVKQRLESSAKPEARDAKLQYKMLEYRLLSKIRAQNAKKLCERYRRQSRREDRKHYANMKDCYGRQGCRAFARCTLSIW